MAIATNQFAWRIRVDRTAAQGGTPVWAAAQNSTISVPYYPGAGSVPFRIRFAVENTGSTTTASSAWDLFVSKNGGAYSAVTTATSFVKAADGSGGNSANNSAISSQLLTGASGTFANGQYNDTGATATQAIAATHTTEFEFGMEFLSTVVPGDTYAFRVYIASVALNTYTSTPTITIANANVRAPYVPAYDEPTKWGSIPLAASVALLSLLSQQPSTQISRAPFYAPKPFVEAAWQGSPTGRPQVLSASAPTPFQPTWYKSTLYQDTYWSGEPVNSAPIQILTVGGKPPTKQQWEWNSDTSTYWSGEPVNSAPIQILTAGGQPPTPLWNWKYNYDGNTWWTGSALASQIIWLLVEGGEPLHTVQWSSIDSNLSTWQPTTQRPMILLSVPFFSYPQFGGYQPDTVSSQSSPQNSTLRLLTESGQPQTKTWRYDPDQYSVQSVAAAQSISLQMTGSASQPPTKAWRYDPDVAAVWLAGPSVSDVLRLLTEGGQPPTVAWRYDLGQDAVVTWRPASTVVLSSAVASPKTLWSWRYDYSDQSDWSWSPPSSARPVVLLSVPFFSYPRFISYQLDAIASSASQQNSTLRLLTEAGQPPTKAWRYDFDVGTVPSAIISQPYVLRTLEETRPPAKLWRYDLDNSVVQAIAAVQPYVLRTLEESGQPPAKLWRYDLDSSVVQSSAVAQSYTIRLLTAGGKPPTKPWRYDLDPSVVQSSAAAQSSTLRLLTSGGQPPTKPWRYDLDTSVVQAIAAVQPYTLLMLSAGGQPPTKAWRYDADFDATQSLIFRNDTIVLASIAPLPTFTQYASSLPQDSVWAASSVSAKLLTEGGQPFSSVTWRLDDYDASTWDYRLYSPTALYHAAPPPPTVPIIWQRDLYAETPPWYPRPAPSIFPRVVDVVLRAYVTVTTTFADVSTSTSYVDVMTSAGCVTVTASTACADISTLTPTVTVTTS